MKFRVILEFDSEAKAYAVSCPELPGCTSAGDSEDEALSNIREAIELYLQPSALDLDDDAKVIEVEVA